jgi:phage terminase large subunit GpA-like protein
MNALSDPDIEQVVFVSASQCGKTECLLNSIGYHVHHDPAPMLLVQPTLEMGQAFSKDRLAPMVRDTPALSGKIADPRTRDSGNTTLHKTFPGGHITICGSNSPASLASRPVRIVLLDEVDRFAPSAGSEGDPVLLAIRRSATFWNRKVVLTSTPTIKGESRIMTAFEESDQRRYWVPCQSCGELQVMEWKQVQWPESEPERASYVCKHCSSPWSEKDRLAAIALGEWRAEAEFKGIAGFHLPGLASPWISLGQAAQDFLRAKTGGSEQLQTWVNTYLAEVWDDNDGESVDELGLYARREPWERVPEAVQVITAGIDTQDDRLEITFVGFGAQEEAWVLEHRIIWADPSTPQCWQELSHALAERWIREDGLTLRTQKACIDSGGHHTQAVYTFALSSRVASAIKGVFGSEDDPIVKRPSKAGARVQVFPLVSNKAKASIYFRLQRHDPGPGFIHFHDSLDPEWFEQLTAERMRRSYNRGKLSYTFKAIRERNEALDCMAYALGALAMLNVRDWSALTSRNSARLGRPVEEPAKSPEPSSSAPSSSRRPPPRRSGSFGGWVGGWR